MTATEKLRALLDERGVEYEAECIDFSNYLTWGENDCYSYTEYPDGTVLRIWDCTPEQAIAATLGSISTTVDDILSLLDEMNEQGRIEYADYSQLHDAIAATLLTVDSNTNYHKLFGTPERAARTMVDMCEGGTFDDCGGCPAALAECKLGDYDALLDWLMGDA